MISFVSMVILSCSFGLWHRPAVPIRAEDLPALLEELAARFREIERETGEKRRAAIAASGLPEELVAGMLRMGPESSPLTSRDQYDQSSGMPQANSTALFQQPVGKPLRSKGPIAKHARRLGITMTALADKIGAKHWDLRNWDKRDSVPPEIVKRLEALPTPAKSPKRSK